MRTEWNWSIIGIEGQCHGRIALERPRWSEIEFPKSTALRIVFFFMVHLSLLSSVCNTPH